MVEKKKKHQYKPKKRKTTKQHGVPKIYLIDGKKRIGRVKGHFSKRGKFVVSGISIEQKHKKAFEKDINSRGGLQRNLRLRTSKPKGY